MTEKLSDEKSDTNQSSLVSNSTPYKSVEEEFNQALKDITFTGMAGEFNEALQKINFVGIADECFEGFFMWWSE